MRLCRLSPAGQKKLKQGLLFHFVWAHTGTQRTYPRGGTAAADVASFYSSLSRKLVFKVKVLLVFLIYIQHLCCV